LGAFLERCGHVELVDSIDDNPEVLIIQGNEVLLGPKINKTSDKNDDRRETSLGDFVLSGDTSQVIDPLLKEYASRQIPLICVDPDFRSVNPDKSVFYMPGTIAKRYEELVGSCVYFGKPHAPGFEEGIQRLLALGVSDKSRIAMIGDSLYHDVAGANIVGIDSILVLGGVHHNDLGNGLGEISSQDKREALFAKEHQVPTIVAPLLKL
jgi:ribonucleotide monophosphatase NagD (HAD superfamily)